jgi:hypothetical protein
MTKYQEEPSLMEVRKWKEQCGQENSLLTQEEYLRKLKLLVDRLNSEYHLNLQSVSLPSVKQ